MNRPASGNSVHACNSASVPSRVFKGLCEAAKQLQDGNRSGSTGLARWPVSGIQERLRVCMQSLELLSGNLHSQQVTYCFGAQRGSSNAHTCPHKLRHCHHCDVMLMLPLSRRTLSQRAQSAPSRKSICKASAGKGKLTTDIFFNPLKEVRELFDGKLAIRERPEPWSRNRCFNYHSGNASRCSHNWSC